MKTKVLKKVSAMIFLPLVIISCEQPVNRNTNDGPRETVAPKRIENPTAVKKNANPYHIEIERISVEQFRMIKQAAKANMAVEKITDFRTVQEQLAGIVEFEEQGDYLGIKSISYRNGDSLKNETDLSECSFVSYFPREDVLLLECGHTTDVSFDLATGRTTYDIGNLNLVTTSPNGKYRLNKVFEGQECYYHFIQSSKGGKFEKIFELNGLFEKKFNKWLCVVEQECWNENTLCFGLVTQYREEGNEYEYYKATITDN